MTMKDVYYVFSDEQKADWQKAREELSRHPCKCGVCAANIYLKIRAERIAARQKYAPVSITQVNE